MAGDVYIDSTINIVLGTVLALLLVVRIWWEWNAYEVEES